MLRKFETRPSVLEAGQSCYRVMLLRANGQSCLIRMNLSMGAARKVARKVVGYHLKRLETNWQQIVRRPDRPRAIYVQVWNGTAYQGTWETPVPRSGGYQFEFHDRRRGPKQSHAGDQAQPKWETGSLVDCLLLAQKTRRGGWRAKIADTQHKGPVTNWQDIPSHFCAGDRVELKLCSISKQTGAAQFAWPS